MCGEELTVTFGMPAKGGVSFSKSGPPGLVDNSAFNFFRAATTWPLLLDLVPAEAWCLTNEVFATSGKDIFVAMG